MGINLLCVSLRAPYLIWYFLIKWPKYLISFLGPVGNRMWYSKEGKVSVFLGGLLHHALLLNRPVRTMLPVVASWNTKGKLQSVVLVIFTSIYFLSLRGKKINCIYPVSTRIFNHYICFSSYFLSYYFILWYNYKVGYV